MKKLSKFLVFSIILLSLNGCATMYVNIYTGPGVKPDVKKEMVKNEKRMTKDRRYINKGHRQQRRDIEKSQNQPWK